MLTLCVVLVMCCGFSSQVSAASKFLDPDPRSQIEIGAEQSEGLHEEMKGQESIISKVGVFNYQFVTCLIQLGGKRKKNIHPFFFVAAW